MAENPNSRPVITTVSSPYLECGNSSTGTPWYDKESVLSLSKYLIFVEVVSTLLKLTFNYNGKLRKKTNRLACREDFLLVVRETFLLFVFSLILPFDFSPGICTSRIALC